jgi:hypothetical protein
MMPSDKSREDRLRQQARKQDKFFHKSRKVFLGGGVRAKYFVSDLRNRLVAVYANLEAAEEDFEP